MKIFERAKKYKEDHGHCWIPTKTSSTSSSSFQQGQTTTRNDDDDQEKEDPDNDDKDSLRRWARVQRVSYSNLRKKRTSYTGCSTSSSTSNNSRSEEGTHQHPQENNDQHDDTLLDAERVALLDSIGFIWEYKCTRWWMQFNELVDFKWQTGHTKVPAVYRGNQSLGSWVRTQRRNFALRKLPMERLVALIQIGFEFCVKPGRKTKRHNNRWDLGVRG